jgi:glycosyltransferase involved in cell wall biosynthesis
MDQIPPRVAVVVPVYNNVTTLVALCDRIRASFGSDAAEIVLVDDGSSDGSRDLLPTLGARAILHERNLGQNQAILTGLSAAQADVYCALDADLEDPPEALPRLVAALGDRGVQAAFSSRDERRPLSSRLFRRALRATFPTLPPYSSLCFAIDRATRDRLVAVGRASDYVVALIGGLGVPTAQVDVRREARGGGVTGYAGAARYRYAFRMLRATLRARWRGVIGT